MTDGSDDSDPPEDVAASDLSGADFPELDDVCELATRLLGASGTTITVADGSGRVLAAHGTASGEPGATELLTTSAGTHLAMVNVYGTAGEPTELALIARQTLVVLHARAAARRADGLAGELARSEHQLAMFVRKLSHDLKTPLTAIMGFTELALDVPAVTADAMALSFLQRCRSAGLRMLDMIDRVHAFARVDDAPVIRDVGLAEVLPRVLAEVGDPPDADISWADGIVPAEAGQLTLLLTHLVGNAVVYRRPGVPARVHIDVTASAGGVLLRVRDNGSGIAAGQREEAMRPLTRLRDDVPGSGLGLAICARIMRAHGGRIELEDSPGGGTTVTALFPGASRRLEMKRLVRR